MSTTGLMAGHPMKQNFLIHPTKNAKMVIMKIADGTYETYDLGHYAFILHTGNSYVEGDVYSTYHPTYIGSEDPFEFQSFNFMLNPDRTNVSPKNEFRRYDINMKTKEVTYETIITMTKDVIDFPIINPTWYGKKNCFTWVSELLFSQGSTAILKIDHCHGNKITRWEEAGTWVSEPFFVDDPTTHTEDAGTIMVSIFDQKLNKNRLVMINA